MNVAQYIDLDSMDPAATLLAAQMRRFMKEWPRAFLDVLHQTHRDIVTLEDAYVMSLVWHEVARGNFFTKRHFVGSVPGANAALDYNRSLLEKASLDFSLTCSAGQDADGWVRLKEPRGFRVSPDWHPCCLRPQALPLHLPLEVGSTHVGNLWFHMLVGGGFVRWPYGDKFLHVWVLGEALKRGLE